MNRYLLEIGVEEFPAKYIDSTKNQIVEGINKLLREEKYDFDKITINSTPRRFAVLVDGISSKAENSVEKVKGPAKKIAYDQEGNPSRALQGFMKSKKVTIDDISLEELNGEEYVYAHIKTQAKPLEEVLSQGIPAVIRNISNPKAMKWGGKNLRFLRPIRWIVSLLDDQVLDFDLEKISVGRTSKGHRFLGSSEIIIDKIDDYEGLLEENYVIVDEEKRKNIIVRGINKLAKANGGNVMMDEDLLYEVVHINEYPTPFIGGFDPEYLELPKEVIITPMKDHQRYFPILDDNNRLLPYFISVRNGDDKGMENVAKGNEKVLVARLEDAKFFYNQDMSKPLEDYVEDLKNLGYHENLGSMYDKTKRLEKLVKSIGELLEAGDDAIKLASRAAFLSKADLVTKTVIEFTELEGTMGRIYADKSKENSIVAKAIEEQYMPRQAKGQLPKSTAGVMLSIVDKLDSICGLHALDIQVTGSQDPYGQRRAALGIINILIDNKMSIDLSPLIRDCLYNFVEGFGLDFSYEEISSNIVGFIKSRLRNKLIEDGFRYDIIDSVLEQENLDIYEMYLKVKDLSNFIDERENSEDILTGFIRVNNITKDFEDGEINTEVLEESDLKVLGLNTDLEEIDKLIFIGDYKKSLEYLETIMVTLNEYLDNTMINVEDERLKTSRLKLVKNVGDRILEIFNPKTIVRK